MPSSDTSAIGVVGHILTTSAWNVARLLKAVCVDWLVFRFYVVAFLVSRYEWEINETFENFWYEDLWVQAFVVLFIFKYLKVVVHTISFLLYRPYPIPAEPTVNPEDVTVIIPTVGLIDELEF